MPFPRSVLQSILALYGFGSKLPGRRHRPPLMIGRPIQPPYS
ncbi:hypothetical protein [Brevundimonas sp.]|nr:hypothetical protein [Brevundimonas sp.]